jgi:glycine cleavage system aminomethyltransferase T
MRTPDLPFEEQLRALRLSAALSDMPHVRALRLVGADALDGLDRLCPADLFMREGQILHTLLLEDSGRALADLYVGAEDGSFLLLAEGPSPEELRAHLEGHLAAGSSVELVDLDETHRILSLNGPYAWEVLAGLAGPEVVGLPYLTFYATERFTCLRAGKTGEFGYDLLVERGAADGIADELARAASRLGLDLAVVGLPALDHCALENWFFNIRREGRAGLTPLELQLQWRVSCRKPGYVGAAALEARRRASGGIRSRLTCFVSGGPLRDGEPVWLGERCVGRWLSVGYSPWRAEWVGLALVDIDLAHAGLDGFHTLVGPRRVAARTVAPPVLNNRSLFIDLQRHSYQTRDGDEFPPIV